MKQFKRCFLIVLDSFGIGEMPDAAEYGDAGSNTLRALVSSGNLDVPNLRRLGLFHIDGAAQAALHSAQQDKPPMGCYARMREASKGKDTTTGHWEIAGLLSNQPMPVYPKGFPEEVLARLTQETGREILCNQPYSGTDVIRDYGKAHMETGRLVVYTSADSVLQIAAHESIIPLEELYRICETARGIMTGVHSVGRIIARPFTGEPGCFQRTAGRHDFSLTPPAKTMLDVLSENGYDTIGIGKIYDIFAGRAVSAHHPTTGNQQGMEKTLEIADADFNGLAFVNLVDFDMLYGHRNDVDGYTASMNMFDAWLPELFSRMRSGDVLMITADHGCDPSTESTDHSREYTPLLIYGKEIRENGNLHTRSSFADIAATITQGFGCKGDSLYGESMLQSILAD